LKCPNRRKLAKDFDWKRILLYKLSQEQEILRETIREFARTEIAPLAADIDESSSIPQELLVELPEFGLYGITLPAESGGAGADFLSLVVSIEEVSKASGSLGARLCVHNAIVGEAFLLSENTALRGAFLHKLASGSLGAFALYPSASERERGVVSCSFQGSNIILEGSASFVINAASADIFLIRARVQDTVSDEALVAFSKSAASKDAFEISSPKKLLGMRASDTATLSFHDLKLPIESLVSDVAQTGAILEKLNARARLAIAAVALGIGQASVDASVKYANERSQFNTKIGKFYAVQEMIASDIVSLESARSITYQAAAEINSSRSLGRDSATAKICSSNAALGAARHSIRIHGGYGFTRDYPVERYARDARLTLICFESNERLKSEIARIALS
jgi:alkylation response protein AidB-like acyl-CoA dehydrogenase